MLLSWIVLIIALALFGVLGFWIFSALFGRGEALPPMMETEDVKAANREAVAEGRFDDIELEVVHRGYRMDQVDALIAQLTGSEQPRSAVTGDGFGVESEFVSVESEGEPSHGSNETAHR